MFSTGIHRSVQINETHVTKTARNRIAIYCNKVEVSRSGTSKYLARVIEFTPDYKIIKMEKVQIPSIKKRLAHAKMLKHELKGFSDIHWYNIGEKDGMPMLYDYGDTFVLWRIVINKIKKVVING